MLLAPGMGDAIQAAKAGILEVADLFIVNKADKPDAQQVVRDLRGMLALGTSRAGRLETAHHHHHGDHRRRASPSWSPGWTRTGTG